MSSIELGQHNLDRGRYEAAYAIFFDLAKNELNDEAAFALNKMVFDGNLDAEQMETLFEWQNSNSSLGNGYAHFNVGLIYEKGTEHIKQNFKTAKEYYEKAIKEEVWDACANLGNLYISGAGIEQGVARDVAKGMALLSQGAENGSRIAAFTLGSLYGKDEMVGVNLNKSFYYLTLAAFMKHDQAKRVLYIFSHAHKENYSSDFADAEQQYWKIENMRKLYKCL